jgi:restriction alleviation protein Lar
MTNKEKGPNLPESVVRELLPCPFCGANPEIEHWHGGGPQKRLISCRNDDCAVSPSVTGPMKKKAITAWNTRSEADATYWKEQWRAANARAEGVEELVSAMQEMRWAWNQPGQRSMHELKCAMDYAHERAGNALAPFEKDSETRS